MPNWKSPEARDRLMAALVASLDAKALNYRRIAMFYAQGTTYDSIEGQFRPIRKRAAELREEAEDGAGSVPDPPARGGSGGGGGGGEPRRRKANGSGIGAGTNKKAKKADGTSLKRDAVLGGRVTKSKSITPTNNTNKQPASDHNTVKGFKQEIESSDASAVGTPADSFGLFGYDGTCDSFLTDISCDLVGFNNSFTGFPGADSDLFEA